jgi:diacylglycerol kinase (ATP)
LRSPKGLKPGPGFKSPPGRIRQLRSRGACARRAERRQYLPLRNSTLIYNPVAGRHPARREKEIGHVAALLREAGIAVKLAPTSGPGAACELAQNAVRQGDDLVLVCGGDGTVNEVINGLAPGATPLGIVPGGTANIIAKELRLPHNPMRAAHEFPGWKPQRIALGQATWRAAVPPSASAPPMERRFFLSVAGVGFDAYIVHRLSTSFKLSWGVAAYVTEAVLQALRYPFPSFVCQTEQGERRATFAVIHRSGHYAGWLPLAPTASLFRPSFSTCFFKSRSRARYFLYAAAVFLRQHLRLRDVELLEGRKFDCAGEVPGKPLYFELDGELVGELPASFEIVPDALTLLVPPLRH